MDLIRIAFLLADMARYLEVKFHKNHIRKRLVFSEENRASKW